VGVTGILGGAFDPPHEGHVALARAAKARFGLDRLLVLVAAAPGHKGVDAPAEARLALARAAFPDEDVRLDEHARTVDLLRDEHFDDPLFLIGADEFCDFPDWKDPNGVLELTRLAVATRPGYPEGRIQSVLDRLDHPERVEFFEIEPHPVASRDLRERLRRGQSLDDLVPARVAELIRERGLYHRGGGLH
jgi:nicotinate-nucleotide adenylyltransferase